MIRPVLAAVAVALTAAAPAQAAQLRGTTTLTLDGLRASADRGAERSGGRVVLPVRGGTVGARSARLEHRGRVVLRRGARRVTLTSLRLELGRRSVVTARAGGRRRTVLRLDVRPSELTLDARADRVTLVAARATPAAWLRMRGVAVVGTTVGAVAPVPAPLARPAGAVDLASSAVTWHVRESFIRYINAGEGASAADGATAGPPTAPEGGPPLVHDFGFTPAGGWHDPATGRTRALFRGTVRFRYAAHGIDIRASDPEIEIAGPASRAILRIGGRRTVLVDLHPDRAPRSLEEIPGTIPEGTGTSVFSGFYQPGDPFGWFTLQFTTRT